MVKETIKIKIFLSFRKMIRDNFVDIRRSIYVEVVQSYKRVYFLYNPKKVASWRVISDNWIQKLEKYGTELGYSKEDIDYEIFQQPDELCSELFFEKELIDFLGTKATPEQADKISEEILKSFVKGIEKLLKKRRTGAKSV
jgi:hypothetical protein